MPHLIIDLVCSLSESEMGSAEISAQLSGLLVIRGGLIYMLKVNTFTAYDKRAVSCLRYNLPVRGGEKRMRTDKRSTVQDHQTAHIKCENAANDRGKLKPN